jgi:transcriptional regulator of NAD metabolism
MTENRRNQIARILSQQEVPVTGSCLAKQFEVSRQVIVQDIAVLRASGLQIVSTSKGYMIPKQRSRTLLRTFASTHKGFESLEEELRIIIDFGGRIVDVMVDHPVYGEIVAALMIDSREDLEVFLNKLRESDAVPLSALTEGLHFHTIEVPSAGVYNKIEQRLKEKGFIPEQPI